LRSRSRTSSARLLAALGQAFALSALALCVGCDTKGFLDPTEMGSFKKDPMVMPIVSQIDPANEEPDNQWVNATDPTADDLKAYTGDYRISPNDLIQIQISDLTGPNTETVKTARITESGNISLPVLKDSIHAAGLSEIQLERAIIGAYKNAQLIENATVTVTVAERRGSAFTIYGQVGQAGQYPIVDSDFRLLNAIVLGRDVTSTFVDYIYVMRKPEQPASQVPASTGTTGTSPTTTPATAPSSDDLAPKSTSMVDPVAGLQRPQRLVTATDQSFDGFHDYGSGENVRVIRIPYQALRQGELKFNVTIRPGDVIYVAPPQSGFYFVGGHVVRPGSFQLLGQPITLTQAIIGASMLDGLAIPQRTDIVRYISPGHQVIARVDLAKIFAGESPDIYIKPGDQIRVGTNAIAPFLAAIRGGFRITYGFGFLFDRNYAYSQSLGVP
jgi:protein involved in polysaccharide export with SLBB domain